mmetsp:Transcript_10291/g.19748  ORF Transcript_10291/g.19748 Transcript_10291/m.19748 type:complete len:194 (-) Transcript_10291:107-688(-)
MTIDKEFLAMSFSEGFLLMLGLVFLTTYLETTCPDEVFKLVEKKGGTELYTKEIFLNLFNTLVLGTLTYVLIVEYLCEEHPLSNAQKMRGIVGVVVIENVLFYAIHRAFHEVKGLFQHHFNEIKLPSTAMAVSIPEFVIAYLVPIVIGCVLLPIDRSCVFLSAVVLGASNLLMHTPCMRGWKIPWLSFGTIAS